MDVVGLRVEGRRVDGLRVVGLFVVGRAVGVVGPTGSSNVGLRDVGRFVGVDEGLRVVGLIVGVNVGLLLMSPVAVIDMVRFWVGMNIPTRNLDTSGGLEDPDGRINLLLMRGSLP